MGLGMSVEPGAHQVETLIQAGLLEIGDGYRAKNSELSNIGIPFARAGNINDGFRFAGADMFPANDLARVGSKISRPGDVVFTSKGTVGRFALVEERSPQFVYSPQLCYWRSLDFTVIRPEYLYYWMSSQEFLHQIGYLKGQTDMADYVSLRDQRRMTVTIPPVNEQVTVADCLKPIDDRIALLRETNATLEAIAQALFKSWFVDFDPVRAKSQGLAPAGMDEATAALFPDSFEASARGLTPNGWPIAAFTDTVNVDSGGTPKTSVAEYWGGGIPWFSIVDAPNGSDTYVVATEKSITPVGLQNCASKLLPVGATIISARGTVGRLALVGREMAMNQSCYGLRGKAGDSYFTYFTTRGLVDSLKQRSHGSVFDTITRETLASVAVVVTPTPLVNQFEATVAPVMQRIRENLLQAQTLATLRDTLLPRLISGQLRLPQIQAEIEEAAA